MKPPRLRRSLLFVPATHARALAKAAALEADVVVIDLEDAVAPARKEEARALAAAALAAGPFAARERLVRVNALATPWGADDLAWAAGQPLDGVLLPKVESATTVRHSEALLGPRALWCQIETPRGVLALEGVAGASARLEALVIGTSDLTKDLRARHVPSRAPLMYALSRLVLVARAFGLDAIDGVQLALDDHALFERSCADSAAMGFDGRSLIHPAFLEAAHRAYGPSPEAVADAEALVASYRAAVERGEGVAVHGGALVEQLHVEAAERVLALARLASVPRG